MVVVVVGASEGGNSTTAKGPSRRSTHGLEEEQEEACHGMKPSRTSPRPSRGPREDHAHVKRGGKNRRCSHRVVLEGGEERGVRHRPCERRKERKP